MRKFRKFLCCFALALFALVANAETWKVGDRADITKLKDGDVIAMKNVSRYLENPYTEAGALPNGASALWFGCYHTMASHADDWGNTAVNYSYGMFPDLKDKSAFRLVEGAGANDKSTFYLQEMSSGNYLALTFESQFSISLVPTTAAATDFAFEKNPDTAVDAEWLVHYEDGTFKRFAPLNSYGFMFYGTASDIDGWNFYYVSEADNSFLRGEQVDETEVENGLRVLLQNPVNYNREQSIGEQYLDNNLIASDAMKYVDSRTGDYLYFSHGYSETNVWVLEASGDNAPDTEHSAYYYLKNEASKEYLTADAEHTSTTADKNAALTFTFGPSTDVNYGYFGKGNVVNEKSVSMKDHNNSFLGSAHNYGYAVHGWGDAGIFNLYKVVASDATAKKNNAYQLLQERITEYEATYSDLKVVDYLPSYTAESIEAYKSALAAAKALTSSNTIEEIQDAYNTLPGILKYKEIEDGGYYYAVNANTKSSETLALRVQSGDTQLGYGILDENNASYVFQATKSTNNGNYWFFQSFDTELYIGRAEDRYNTKINLSETPADNQLQALRGVDNEGVSQPEAYFWTNVYGESGSNFGTTFVPDRFGWHANSDNEATEGLIYNFAVANDPANYNYNRWYLIPVSEEVIAAMEQAKEAAMFETLGSLIAQYDKEGITSKRLPGFTEASVAEYESARAKAKAIKKTDDCATQKAAYDALKEAHLNLVEQNIEDGATYYIVSAYTGREETLAVTIEPEISTTNSRWAVMDKPNSKFIFKFSVDNEHSNYWYVQNVENGWYLSENDNNDFNHSYGQHGVISQNAEHSHYFKRMITSGLPYAYFWYSYPYNYTSWRPEGYDSGATSGLLYNWGQAGDNNIDNHNRWYLVPVKTKAVTIGATGYSTYVNDNALIVPTGVTVYGVTGFEGDELQLTQLSGEVLAANEPVILQGEAGKTYHFIYTEDEGSAIAGNLLEGTGTEGKAVAEDEAYVLYNNKGTAVFRRAAAMTLPAYKAYLPASVIGGAQSNMFNLGNNITGIANAEAVTPGAAGATYYDMQGRRVSAPQKGQLYIVNGKKVIY
ncbi:MAG: hypothetical protein J1F13_01390 [Prevotellaceae bacterium]|nr:hypothetical protein [Prevotellaceae bacterium]